MTDQDAAGRTQSFQELVNAEMREIFAASPDRPGDSPRVEPHDAADEPRVIFRAADIIGLALSGGGIRSATFNLGFIQGLRQRDLLGLFDYLSTVSGGGYIGSFWSDWLVRRAKWQAHEKTRANLFPPKEVSPFATQGPESKEERHLREFSRFLAPRLGFFEVETWTAIVALLAGLIPALMIGFSVIGLLLVGWLTLTLPVAFPSGYRLVEATVVLITIVTLLIFEHMTHAARKTSTRAQDASLPAPWYQLDFWVWTAAALVLVVIANVVVTAMYPSQSAPLGQFDARRFWLFVGLDKAVTARLHIRLFDYSLTWAAAAVVMLLARLAIPLRLVDVSRDALAMFDRTVMRLMGLAVAWTALALVWHVILINEKVIETAAAAVASGAAFAAMRNWIGVALRKSTGSGLLTRLRPYLPQLLAYLTVLLFAIVVGSVLIGAGDTDLARWSAAFGAMAAVAIAALFIDTSRFGLHAFYRDRLSRAFAGANNLAEKEGAAANRGADPRDGDDRSLSELVGRPLHLVCCAANDLSGDTVETLGRGARSAVLSRLGLAMGNCSSTVNEVSLGSAITASAAAFNSTMGMVSLRVGPAVSFVMTALNLRLGLWVRHPGARISSYRRFPGLLLYREMFGLTSASGAIGNNGPSLFMRDIHLSDGGHFENLALYELVRRHCRYIVVSDCGADPSVAFDDLGNALRRIREDFGVDISLDIEPLRPAPVTGLSTQHVAVGTIHYSSTDRGILLYVKPSITGDEPPDVLQYRTQNREFPHESTADQFYDEAQYESYRRLGLHVADQVFDFVPPNPFTDPASGAKPAAPGRSIARRPPTGDWVFATALHKWGPTPAGLVESILAMTERFGKLEMDLQRQGCDHILREVFPELSPSPNPPVLATKPSDLPFFIRVTQLMEDAWIGCQLEQWWDHPLNLGWVNLFARWATAPSFRYWWPVLSPMYCPGFRSFVDRRFEVPVPAGWTPQDPSAIYVPQQGQVRELVRGGQAALSELWWRNRAAQPLNWDDRTVFENIVPLPVPGGKPVELQVGLAAVRVDHARGRRDAGWTSNDFFVPPSFWGAGFGWYFLNGLLTELANRDYRHCYVVVKGVAPDAHHRIAADDQRSFIEQYRKIGFRQEDPHDVMGSVDNSHILKDLGFDPSADTLFILELARWARRRG